MPRPPLRHRSPRSAAPHAASSGLPLCAVPPRRIGHAVFVGAQLARRLAKFGQITAAGDKAILALGDQFARAPLVRDHARQARGLRFEDDVSESVRRAGEDEEVGRSISGRQLLTREITGENPFGKGFSNSAEYGPCPTTKPRTGSPAARSFRTTAAKRSSFFSLETRPA